MTTETIDNPTWDDVRECDIVVVERGVPDTVGYTRCTCEAIAARVFQSDGWRIVRIVREVPDPLPDHTGALAFAAQGLGCSDGDGPACWEINSQDGAFYYASELIDPVEALPVPAKELRELIEIARFADGPHDADDFIAATRREWKRAGIDGGLVELSIDVAGYGAGTVGGSV